MLGSGRFLYKQVDCIPKVFNAVPKVRHCASKVGEQIVIPARIEREPTDILKALASTVNLDPTAFSYRCPDDPYFYTYNQSEKRVLALCVESGIKSAKWVVKENTEFFKHQLSEPPIEVFFPKINDASETEITEESLLNAIEERNVLGAIEAYKTLKSNQQNVQKSTKQSLLELVCFYNGKEKPNLEFGSKWYEGYMGKAGAGQTEKTNWDATGFAKSLFEEMGPDCPLATSALIQGMLKHDEIKSALELYESAKVKKIKLSVGVYNSLISEAPSIVQNWNEISPFVVDKLQEMSKESIRPNLGTLNAALKALSKTNNVSVAEKLVKEFMGLGIAPSLGSYGYLFQCFGRLKPHGVDKMPRRKAVGEIMRILETEKHKILHPSDLEFFTNSMDVFVDFFKDCELALRLNNMYSKLNNMKFITRAEDEYGF